MPNLTPATLAENMLQVFEMQSILRYGAGADDVDSRHFEPLVNVL